MARSPRFDSMVIQFGGFCLVLLVLHLLILPWVGEISHDLPYENGLVMGWPAEHIRVGYDWNKTNNE